MENQNIYAVPQTVMPGPWSMPNLPHSGWLRILLDKLNGVELQLGDGPQAEIIIVSKEEMIKALCRVYPEILKRYAAARLATDYL